MITPFTSAIRNNNKPRILIVDDNPRFSHSARLILQQSGQYVVCEENDAAGAVETARSFRPDLTLLDLIMPGVDGAEVAAQIESDWGWLSGLLWVLPLWLLPTVSVLWLLQRASLLLPPPWSSLLPIWVLS
jgi:CheY-like chemotaxis protein